MLDYQMLVLVLVIFLDFSWHKSKQLVGVRQQPAAIFLVLNHVLVMICDDNLAWQEEASCVYRGNPYDIFEPMGNPGMRSGWTVYCLFGFPECNPFYLVPTWLSWLS